MQNSVLKFLTIILLALFLSPLILFSKPIANTDLLSRADSLFQQKRYTQSFEIYKSLFENNHYSPSMLLKMAFIQEGLNRISQSVYYLNLYYVATQDEAAFDKMEEMAKKYRLDGYSKSEFDRVFSIYDHSRSLVTVGLSSIFILLVILIGIQRLYYGRKPAVSFGMLCIVSVIFFVHLNFSNGYSKAIVVNNNTYLMDAPSSGASVVSIVRDGHRLTVLGKKDVWVKVQWGDSEAYIKENNLLLVKL